MNVLGIDIGGSGIKGALVDTEKGVFIGSRYRIPTPKPSKPKAVAKVIAEIVAHFNYKGAIGCTFPAIMKSGVAHSAANVHSDWIKTDVQTLIRQRTGCENVLVLNDADAAGLAEVHLGAGRGQMGTVIVLTLGTGIGSAMFVDGRLMPNTELGHLQIRGKVAEKRAADRIRKFEDLTWKQWAKRLNEFLSHVEFIFSPDLFIIGGGVSKKYEKYFPHLTLETKIVPATLRNRAGIIGAAMAVAEQYPDAI